MQQFIRTYPCFSIKNIALLLLFTTLIALFLTALVGTPFVRNIVFSQSIGLCIYFFANLLKGLFPNNRSNILIYIIAVPLGGITGIIIGSSIIGVPISSLFGKHINVLFTSLTSAIMFGLVITYYFYSRSKLYESSISIREQQIKQLAQEKTATEINLRLLQAQIEPHFLFNTLSNVTSMIESNPIAAKSMLDNLTIYLRATLKQTRTGNTTLADELGLLEAYIKIHKIRMGQRLNFSIDCSDDLKNIPFAPLMIQPLVENAIQHGIAPSVSGGDITLRVRHSDNNVEITVENTCTHMDPGHKSGVGLKNIRERLNALYGDAAQFSIFQTTPHSVTARIVIPYPGTT